jgi:cystinosin
MCIGIVILNVFVYFYAPGKLIYSLGYCNTFILVVKYTPQITLNYNRKSTEGMSLPFFALDFFGSIFSILQQFVDLFIVVKQSGQWEHFSIFSPYFNLIKLNLGLLTLLLDIIIGVQHFALYTDKSKIQSLLKERLLTKTTFEFERSKTFNKLL